MNRIRTLREERGMTQTELGKLISVKDAAISKYESGKVPLTADTIIKLANIFSVSTDYILGLSSTCNNDTDFPITTDEIIPLRLQHLLSEDSLLDVNFYSQTSKIPLKILKKYIKGELSPSNYDLCKLIEVFDTTADYLFGKSEEPHPLTYIPKHRNTLSIRLSNEMDGNFLIAEIAEDLNVSIATVKKFISGEAQPNQEQLSALSKLLCKSTDYLLGISDFSRKKNMFGEYPFQIDSSITRHLSESMDAFDKDNSFWSEMLSINEDEVDLLKNHGFLVHLSVILKVSEILNVSVDYLLNKTDSKEIVTKYQEPLLVAFNKLNTENQSIALGELLKMKKEQEREDFISSIPSVAADEPLKKAK